MQTQRAASIEQLAPRPPPHCEVLVHPQRMSMHSKRDDVELPCCEQSLLHAPQLVRPRVSVQVPLQSTSNWPHPPVPLAPLVPLVPLVPLTGRISELAPSRIVLVAGSLSSIDTLA